MAEYVGTDKPGNLTDASYFDGTDAGTTMMPGYFNNAGIQDADDTMLPAEQGAMGLVGPVTGAQHMPNAAQPGSTSI